eukprot:308305-Rhodomonas_salina.4
MRVTAPRDTTYCCPIRHLSTAIRVCGTAKRDGGTAIRRKLVPLYVIAALPRTTKRYGSTAIPQAHRCCVSTQHTLCRYASYAMRLWSHLALARVSFRAPYNGGHLPGSSIADLSTGQRVGRYVAPYASSVPDSA